MSEGTSIDNLPQFETLISNIPGIVYRCDNDPKWTMRFVSQKIEDLTGYPVSDFINNKTRTLASLIHPDDIAQVDRRVQEGIDKKLPFSLEYRISNKDNETIWVLERGQGVYDKDGNFLWLDGILLDINDLKKLEHLKEEVDRMMRHDLRTPINVLSLCLRLLNKPGSCQLNSLSSSI